MATNDREALEALEQLPQAVLIKKFIRTIKKYRQRVDELQEELNDRETELEEEIARKDAAIDKRDEIISALKVRRRREDEQLKRDLAQARRDLEEAKKQSAKLIASAKRKIAVADIQAKEKLASAKREADVIKKENLRSAGNDIKRLESARENEKRRTIEVYNGMMAHCDELITSMTKTIEELKDVRNGLNAKKKEVRIEEFKTFHISDYIDDSVNDDEYDYSDIEPEHDEYDSDIVSEILESRHDNKTRKKKTASTNSKKKRATVNDSKKKKPERDLFDADLDFSDFADEADDEDDYRDFTGTFVAIKPGKDDDDEDFDLGLLDDFADDDMISTSSTQKQSGKRGAASRWL